MTAREPRGSRSGRHFGAWLGLTRKDPSPAGKTRLGKITRAGDEMLRSLLVAGATAVIQQVRRGRGRPSAWLLALQIGRAASRGRGEISVGAVSFKKKKEKEGGK